MDRIAHILGTLDDKIELNRRMNQTLNEIARTLFSSWFVDFDPDRTRAEGLQPDGMDAETAALFPDRFIDSELGPIPEEWDWLPIGEFVTLVRHTVNPRKGPDKIFDHHGLTVFDKCWTSVRETGAGIASNETLITSGAVLISKLNPHLPVYDFRPSRMRLGLLLRPSF